MYSLNATAFWASIIVLQVACLVGVVLCYKAIKGLEYGGSGPVGVFLKSRKEKELDTATPFSDVLEDCWDGIVDSKSRFETVGGQNE
jgi:hypothetical protein